MHCNFSYELAWMKRFLWLYKMLQIFLFQKKKECFNFQINKYTSSINNFSSFTFEFIFSCVHNFVKLAIYTFIIITSFIHTLWTFIYIVENCFYLEEEDQLKIDKALHILQTKSLYYLKKLFPYYPGLLEVSVVIWRGLFFIHISVCLTLKVLRTFGHPIG